MPKTEPNAQFAFNNARLSSRDLAVLWHPCTQMQDHESIPMVPIKSAQGVWLEDYDGKRYLDAVSSWWVNILGHNHPRVVAGLKAQLDQLSHVMFAGFTHEPAIELAERLIELAPVGLSRVFYADNGSSAVEIALKMSFHAQLNSGYTKRTRFVALSGSYHGETLGALSVTDVKLYRDTYRPLLLEPIIVPSPAMIARDKDETDASVAARCLDMIGDVFERDGESICAVIVEPLVQCAAGMRIYDPGYLLGLRMLCNEYGIHLIADEIAVGFGRTGTLFACEQAQITPDFMCLSKGLTGGHLALAAVLTTQDVYACFYDRYETLRAFLHSHSYSGNALACRAALETLNVLRDENTVHANKQRGDMLKFACDSIAQHPQIRSARHLGMIAAFDLVDTNGDHFDWKERRGLRVYQRALELGVVLRPLGNTVYFMPPYCISNQEITLLRDTALEAISYAVA